MSYASRSLTETEKRYAVIEKEALEVTWACEKFSDYVLGMQFTVETDHKPLVPLLSTTDLSNMPPRILRFRMRLMNYSPKVTYVPGKQQITADALSRAPVSKPKQSDFDLIEEVESFTSQIVTGLPATSKRLEEIKQAQDTDEECVQIKTYCIEGWPTYMPHLPMLKPYWENKGHLAVVDGLLLFDDRIVIPRCLRLDILELIHQGHLGITKCQARARMSVWWPGVTTAITELVTKCSTCAKHRPEPKEPLMSSSFPSRQWERLGMALFQLKGKSYLLVVDYYSRWVEVKRLHNQLAATVISALKEVFATHSIPDLFISDNGPQFACELFQQFATIYGFTHVTSSPRYPIANGEAERAVCTVKEILKKNEDPYLGLLSYRSTPLQNGLAPCELLMSRQLKTQLPALPKTLQPKLRINDLVKLKQKEELYRTNQQRNHDQRHKAKELSKLKTGETVWIRDQDRMGKVLTPSPSLRSYIVQTEKGTLRRNRAALVPTKPTELEQQETDIAPELLSPSEVPPVEYEPARHLAATTQETKQPDTHSKVTRSGRVVKQPKRLIEEI